MDSQQREQVAATWNAGNYAALAERLAGAADAIAAELGAGAGRRALDLAAGTGSLALRLAQNGWRTTALDIAPALIDHGSKRAADLGLDVEWVEASLDEIPLPDDALSVVGSSFGLIFAPDPPAALAEIRRVLVPGGRLVVTTWPHDGYMATMTAVIGTFMPPGAPSFVPFRWGDPAIADAWWDADFTDIRTTHHTMPWRFDDAEAAVDFLFANSPGHVAALTAVGERAAEMRAAVRDHLRDANGGHAPIDMRIGYTLTSAVAR